MIENKPKCCVCNHVFLRPNHLKKHLESTNDNVHKQWRQLVSDENLFPASESLFSFPSGWSKRGYSNEYKLFVHTCKKCNIRFSYKLDKCNCPKCATELFSRTRGKGSPEYRSNRVSKTKSRTFKKGNNKKTKFVKNFEPPAPISSCYLRYE